MNNFILTLKLAHLAAAVLALAVLMSLFDMPAFASAHVRGDQQAGPAREFELWFAASASPSSVIEPRATSTNNRADDQPRLSLGPVLGLICAIVVSSVALGIAFGLRRRIDRLAGRDSEKEADD
ncbi:MAG TPA: hypothetical protein VKE41_03250 [Roseiflexaceae bacterium]|nr:hypothetical protein [Roseiflexaceae bacterium]